MAIKAILWDLDGVLVNSMDFHYRAYSEVLSQRGVKLSREQYLKEMIGLRNYTILRRVLGDLPDEEIMRLAEQKEEVFRRLVRGQVKPLPGAAELVRLARDGGIKQAIVSSTPRANIELMLQSLGLYECFEVVVGEEDAERGKPDPEGFIVAASRLGIAPADCVVIEDAPEGIAGGKAAGTRCIGVSTTRPAEKLSQADLVVESLEDERVWEFIGGRQRMGSE
jgi:HAD superfamily hydrolase (TIGR01509 family)